MLPLLLAPLIQISTHIVIGVVLDKLSAFRSATDWTKLKIEADGKVRAVIPGTMVDDVMVRATNQVIDKIQSALGEKAESEKILTMLSAGDFSGAAKELLIHVGLS